MESSNEMFAMGHSGYSYHTASIPRQCSTTHATSSAFSASANPDEDWTKIADLAERRRIQNRIAQRNYRKKLKQRLEDAEILKKKQGSMDEESPSPPAMPVAENRPAQASGRGRRKAQTGKAPKIKPPSPSVQVQSPQYTPPMQIKEEFMYHTPYEDTATYSPYPAPDDMMVNPYSTAPTYPSMTTAGNPAIYASTTTAMPCTLPALTHFADAMKREANTPEPLVDFVDHNSYSSGLGLMQHNSYDHQGPHTPPLPHFDPTSHYVTTSSFDTGAYYEKHPYPATPLSLPASPNDMTQQLWLDSDN